MLFAYLILFWFTCLQGFYCISVLHSSQCILAKTGSSKPFWDIMINTNNADYIVSLMICNHRFDRTLGGHAMEILMRDHLIKLFKVINFIIG